MAHEAGNEKTECIRSVERAIDLLQALNRRPLSTLHDLHRDTGLPKPSILRILRTLEAKGLAAQSASYGSYQLLGRVKSLASGFHHEPRVVETAEGPMIDFTRREGWPLSLALFDRDAMVVRACTIRFTALSLEHAALDRRLSLLSHAMGRAYLAFSARHEQAILLSIVNDPSREHDDAAVAAMIASTRERGYALRDPLSQSALGDDRGACLRKRPRRRHARLHLDRRGDDRTAGRDALPARSQGALAEHLGRPRRRAAGRAGRDHAGPGTRLRRGRGAGVVIASSTGSAAMNARKLGSLIGAIALGACAAGALSADGPAMPKAYVVAEIDVKDREAYRDYVAAAFPVIQKYGGRFLTRGARPLRSKDGHRRNG